MRAPSAMLRAAALCTLAAAAPGQGLALRGRVLGADGAPVAAHVVLGGQAATAFAPLEALATARAGADGRFALELPRAWIGRQSGYRSLEVLAWGEGHGLALEEWELTDVPAGSELELRLPSDPATRLRFVDEEGAPIAGARAWPERVVGDASIFGTPPDFWLRHGPRTDTNGEVSLPVARAALESVGLASAELGVQSLALSNGAEGSWNEELVAMAARELELRVEAPVPARTELEVTSVVQREPTSGAVYGVGVIARARLDARGRASVHVGAGEAYASVTSEDASALVLGGAKEEDAALVLRPAPTFPVRARVVDAETGAPLAGVRLRVSGLHTGHVTSDADGRVGFDMAAAAFTIEELRPPEGYAGALFPGLEGRRPADGGECLLDELRVARAWTARGRVLGTDGAPAQGAWVVGEQEIPGGRGTLNVGLSAVTDARGEYALAGAHAGRALEVSVRFGELRARGVQAEGAALELVLESALRARGTLLTAEGAPAAEVELEVWRAPPEGIVNGHARVELGGARRFRTDAEGRFETPGGLEPDARYCVAWADPRYERGRSEWLSPAELSAGIELRARELGVARGVLRAADGSPLAGTLVRARKSDLCCTTDAAGRFELAGIPASGELLVAEDADGAPHVLRVAPGEALEWTLLPHGAEHPLAPAPEHDRALELELALELLEARYQAALASGNEGQLLGAVRLLARADPARALERVESGLFETPWMRDFALAYVADALERASPEEALAVAARIERGMSRELAVLAAAEQLPREEELEQLALVRAGARAVDPPEHRAVVLRQLADRLLDLGERAAALEVIAEGRAVAAELPAEEWAGYARGRFGELLARVDLDAGRALIAPLKEDPERHLFNLAHELAASDPAVAEELIEQLARRPGMWSASRYAARIAHRMAPADLERARRIAARDPSGFADGMIALALADSNPAEALVSLDAAFRRAEERAPAPQAFSDQPIASAGALLPVAERLDPANLRAWVERALAVRPRETPRAFEYGAWQHHAEEAKLAFYLARWDRESARTLLEPALERARNPAAADFGDSYDAVFAAAAAIDPEWAAGLARELEGRAAGVVGVVLALGCEERERYVQEELFDMWVVGKEDL